MGTQFDNQVVGIIPCAGLGTRLGPLPFSKELYPLGKRINKGKPTSKVACEYLLDHMSDAGIREIHFILRQGKWDIPAFIKGGLNFGINACYHVADYLFGVPFSVNQAYPIIKGKIVALGFPDILFKPKYAYSKLINELSSNSKISVVLGLMPISRPDKWDMVVLDVHNNVTKLIIKSDQGSQVPFGWTIAVWKPNFSDFLNIAVNERLKSNIQNDLETNEIYFGHMLTEAISAGLIVKGVIFENGECLDIGTPEDLEMGHSFLNKVND